jgi:hypothetical protein
MVREPRRVSMVDLGASGGAASPELGRAADSGRGCSLRNLSEVEEVKAKLTGGGGRRRVVDLIRR